MMRSLVGPVTGFGRSLLGSREWSMGGWAVLAEVDDLAASGLAATARSMVPPVFAGRLQERLAGAGDFAAGLGVAETAGLGDVAKFRLRAWVLPGEAGINRVYSLPDLQL